MVPVQHISNLSVIRAKQHMFQKGEGGGGVTVPSVSSSEEERRRSLLLITGHQWQCTMDWLVRIWTSGKREKFNLNTFDLGACLAEAVSRHVMVKNIKPSTASWIPRLGSKMDPWSLTASMTQHFSLRKWEKTSGRGISIPRCWWMAKQKKRASAGEHPSLPPLETTLQRKGGGGERRD